MTASNSVMTRSLSAQNAPLVTLARYPFANSPLLYFPLVFGLYILLEESQDMCLLGPREYFGNGGLLNVCHDWG